MTSKPNPKDSNKKSPAKPHPGMMGDGTEEQNSASPATPRPASRKTKWTPPSPRMRRGSNATPIPYRAEFAYKGRAGSRPAF